MHVVVQDNKHCPLRLPAKVAGTPLPKLPLYEIREKCMGCLLTWEGPRQAAPMQKRVLPESRALTAACNTTSASALPDHLKKGLLPSKHD